MSDLRRDRDRQRRRRRHARAPARPLGQAHPAARARRLAAARAAELARAATSSSTTATSRRTPGTTRDGQGLPAAGALLRRRRHQALRRGALPPARGGLRRAAPPRRHLARLADRLRRDGALLHAGRAALPGARRARRGPDRAARERALSVPGGLARAADPAALRRPAAAGHHPFHAPCGVMLDEARHALQPCVRCADLRRLPLPRAREVRRRGARRAAGARAPERHAADERQAVGAARPTRPAPRSPRSWSSATATRETFAADIVVVSCGAANSAKLLLASASDKHPNGLANGSDQVGRNYMFHNSQAVLALSKEENPTVFQKTLGLNDFYFGSDDFEFPLGNIQMVGKSSGADVPRREAARDEAGAHADARERSPATRSTSGSRPRTCRGPRTASRLDRDGSITAQLHADQRRVPKQRLYHKLKSMLGQLGMHHAPPVPRHAYLKNDIPVAGCAHQAGTCRFGADPATLGARTPTAAPTSSTTSTSSTRASSRASAR